MRVDGEQDMFQDIGDFLTVDSYRKSIQYTGGYMDGSFEIIHEFSLSYIGE